MSNSGIWKAVGALSVLLLLAGALSARTTSPSSGQRKASGHSSSQSSRSAKSRRSGRKNQAFSRRNWKSRGQQAIQADRAREIQAGLIREHYLTGEPTGAWDERTKTAMAQYQADRGWQTKKLPDARALIQLGLGPTHDGLLNPESVASTERPR